MDCPLDFVNYNILLSDGTLRVFQVMRVKRGGISGATNGPEWCLVGLGTCRNRPQNQSQLGPQIASHGSCPSEETVSVRFERETFRDSENIEMYWPPLTGNPA